MWSTAGRALCVLCSYMGFVMKSILPKARYPSACRSPARSGLAVPACSASIQRDRGRQRTNKHSWHCKQAGCAHSTRCEAPHLFLLLEHLGAAGGVQSISVPYTFLNVFISMCRLHLKEKNLDLCHTLSRNSGKGNGIVK